MSIESKVAELVDKYEHETNKNQSESDVRSGYIDLLFAALGWNVYNDPRGTTGYRREGYIRGAGIVDIGLEIDGVPVLLIEAKRFGVLHRSNERIGDRTLEEKQLFRYARGKKIPYCILTNFERLQVFNADHERLIFWFDDPDEFTSRISELLHLSPEKVQSGSLPATERQLEIKPIDQEFLALLQDWRLHLANSIYTHNNNNHVLKTAETFDFGKLMEAVQRLLDRLILIRYADDKEVLLAFDVIENILSDYHKRGAYASSDHLIRQLTDFSHMMDDHHNTTLFQPGHICEQVFIPNNDLGKILAEINNISFRKFSSDILGNTYETYLSTKLVLKNGSITSEEHTDIRKAGGIYYTPFPIVHYIVDNTLGHKLKELEEEYGIHAIEKVREIKILDPSCGSGSFLIYAYQVLADYYRRINKTIEDERDKLLVGAKVDMFKRMEMFKQLPEPLLDYPHHILEKQLYGVDKDAEAAEIAAVNLTMQAFSDTKREKLPLILNENIKVGNSLIQCSEEEIRSYFGDAWQGEKPFNWEQEFKNIMDGGGFDVVIGNPPYLGERGHKESFREIRCGRLDRYYLRKMDIFYFFLHLALDLSKEGSYIGFITTNYFPTADGAEKLRDDLRKRSIIQKLINFNELKIFKSAFGQHNMIIIMEKGRGDDEMADTCITQRRGIADHAIINEILKGKDTETTYYRVKQSNLYEGDNLVIRIGGISSQNTDNPILSILEDIKNKSRPLAELCNINMGVESGADFIGKSLLDKALKNNYVTQEYLDKYGIKIDSPIYVISRKDLKLFSNKEIKEVIKPFIKNSDIRKYWLPKNPENYYLYLDSETNIDNYSAIKDYLIKFRPILKAREQVKDDDNNWYWIRGAKRKYLINTGNHIICPYRAKRNIFALSNGNYLGAGDVYYITKKLTDYDLRYILAILNSELCYFWLYRKGKRKGEILELYKTPLSAIPIMDIGDKLQSQFISEVDKILALTNSDDYLTNDAKQSITAELQNKIDRMIYELYGLTKDMVTIIKQTIVD